jgi:AFG3 family protein
MKELKNTSKNKQEQEPPKMSMSGIRIFFWMMFLLIAGYFFFGTSSGPVETNWQQFNRTMLQNHDVEKVVVVNQEIAEVHIKRESLAKERYSDVVHTAFGDTVYAGPHYQFHIGSVEVFENRMSEAMEGFAEDEMVPINYSSRFSFSGGLLIWLLPIGFIILFWVLMTRSMRGKGMNNIFNMGKSKAKLYEKENRPNVKFDDVAGLEEAKEEI